MGLVMPLWSDLYSLTRIQKRKFRDLCDIYQPNSIAPATAGGQGKPKSFPSVPTYASVPCRYIATEDFQSLELIGLMTQDTDLTQDRWLINLRQPIGSGWKLVMRTVLRDGNHPLYGREWEVQGEGRDIAAPWYMVLVWAKLGPGRVA